MTEEERAAAEAAARDAAQLAALLSQVGGVWGFKVWWEEDREYCTAVRIGRASIVAVPTRRCARVAAWLVLTNRCCSPPGGCSRSGS